MKIKVVGSYGGKSKNGATDRGIGTYFSPPINLNLIQAMNKSSSKTTGK